MKQEISHIASYWPVYPTLLSLGKRNYLRESVRRCTFVVYCQASEKSTLKELHHKIYQNLISGNCHQLEWNMKITAQNVNTKGDTDAQTWKRFKRIAIEVLEYLYGGTVFQSSFLLLEAFDTTLRGTYLFVTKLGFVSSFLANKDVSNSYKQTELASHDTPAFKTNLIKHVMLDWCYSKYDIQPYFMPYYFFYLGYYQWLRV